MRFAFVEEHSKHVPVERLCRMLMVTSRGYRAWRGRPISRRQREDMVLLAPIREQHHLSLASYRLPRMTQELKEAGLSAGHRRVGRLMRDNRIYVVRTHKYKVTTDSHHRFNVAPNWLDRNFTAHAPNQKWACDISYIWTIEGWLYITVMIDLHSQRVIGWAVSNRWKRDLTLQALRRPAQGVFIIPPLMVCMQTIAGQGIAAVNIAPTIIKSDWTKSASKCPLTAFASKRLPGKE